MLFFSLSLLLFSSDFSSVLLTLFSCQCDLLQLLMLWLCAIFQSNCRFLLNEQFKDIIQIWKDASINVQLNKWRFACNLMHVLAQNVFDIIWSILFRTATSKIEFESNRVFLCQQLYFIDKRNHLFYFLARIFRTFSFLTV